MAIRRMNEMWRRLALHSVLSVLLLQGCQGEDTTVAQQSQGTITPSKAFIGTSIRPTINPTTLIPPVSTYSAANTALPTGARTSTNITIVDVHTPPPPDNTNAPADATSNQKNEEDYVTAQFIPSVSSPGNQALPANTEFTEKPDQSTISLSERPITEDKDILQFRNVNVEARNESAETSSNKKDDKTSSSVFVPVLLTGLALAAVLIGVYVRKNNCQTKGNSMKLAEESDHADEENQGNTLVSVAPLNPPEDQEKPNQNGESLEAVKIQNPPAATNGHSATKADTEF